MRVALLSTFHHNGGAAVAATRLHHALLKNGVESTMLVGAPRQQEALSHDPAVKSLAESFIGDKLAFGRFVAERLCFLPYEKDKSVRFQFSPAVFGADLASHPIVRQADVLHLHWINFGFLSINGLDKLLRLGKPIVWTLHDMWAFTGGCHYSRGCDHFLTHCRQCPYLRNPADNDLSYRVFEQKLRIFQNANLHITPPSAWLGNQVLASTLLGQFPLTVIPNPIDQQVFRPMPRSEVDAHFKLTAHSPRLLFGSFNTTDPRKGFAYFAEALAILKRQYTGPEPEILVFGKGQAQEFAHLPYPVQHLGVLRSEEVVAKAYNAADAMVVPSLEDNLPNTIVEALSCGTPVIGFRTGGIPEMIEHQQTGYLAEAGSALELAKGLLWLLKHQASENLRQNARQFAEKHYAEAVVANQYTSLYRSLI